MDANKTHRNGKRRESRSNKFLPQEPDIQSTLLKFLESILLFNYVYVFKLGCLVFLYVKTKDEDFNEDSW